MADATIRAAPAGTPAGAAVAPAGGGPFAALAYPGIRLIIVGTFFAFSGFWSFNIAQGWVVLELTDSPFMVGIVSACSNLPFLFVSLFAGVLADRVNRKRVSLASRALVVTIMLTEATLVWTGQLEVWMMVVLALTAGIGFSVDNPVRQSMVPDLVAPQHLGNAIALTPSPSTTSPTSPAPAWAASCSPWPGLDGRSSPPRPATRFSSPVTCSCACPTEDGRRTSARSSSCGRACAGCVTTRCSSSSSWPPP